MKRIDLNCDMGESFGAYRIGMDEAVLPHITSANVACGWHAGDPLVMNKTVQLAQANGVGIGAHPGFPDLIGFGRRFMDCSLEEIRHYLTYQVGALDAFCRSHGTVLQHVKPHGALYNAAVGHDDRVRAIAEAIAGISTDLLYVVLAGETAARAARIAGEFGLRTRFEAFPDRAYNPDGTLASRQLQGAVITQPQQVAERALRMAEEGVVVALDGSRVDLEAHTLCVHGDTPTAVELVKSIRQRLEAGGIAVAAMGSA